MFVCRALFNGKAFGGESLFRGYSTQRSQPAGRHASAVSSEGALRLCLAGSVACASEFKPLARPESAREREPRERGPGLRVPVCACAVIALAGVPLLASSERKSLVDFRTRKKRERNPKGA